MAELQESVIQQQQAMHRLLDEKLGTEPRSFRVAGLTAVRCLQVGYSVKDLKLAGFTPKELRDVGFHAHELTAVGYEAGDLREVRGLEASHARGPSSHCRSISSPRGAHLN